MTFRALRTLRGDYGPNGEARTVAAGETFTVNDALVKRLAHLESKGLIERVVPRSVVRKMAIPPQFNKMLSGSPDNKGGISTK